MGLTTKFDTEFTDKEVVSILDDAALSEEYPETESQFEFREYDRKQRTIYLYVTNDFDDEQRKFIQNYLRENLHKRSIVSIIRYDKKFS